MEDKIKKYNELLVDYLLEEMNIEEKRENKIIILDDEMKYFILLTSKLNNLRKELEKNNIEFFDTDILQLLPTKEKREEIEMLFEYLRLGKACNKIVQEEIRVYNKEKYKIEREKIIEEYLLKNCIQDKKGNVYLVSGDEKIFLVNKISNNKIEMI